MSIVSSFFVIDVGHQEFSASGKTKRIAVSKGYPNFPLS